MVILCGQELICYGCQESTCLLWKLVKKYLACVKCYIVCNGKWKTFDSLTLFHGRWVSCMFESSHVLLSRLSSRKIWGASSGTASVSEAVTKPLVWFPRGWLQSKITVSSWDWIRGNFHVDEQCHRSVAEKPVFSKLKCCWGCRISSWAVHFQTQKFVLQSDLKTLLLFKGWAVCLPSCSIPAA